MYANDGSGPYYFLHFELCSPSQIFAFLQTTTVSEHIEQGHIFWSVIQNYKMSSSYRLLVKNAKQVVLICNQGEKYLTKDGMQNLCVIENGSIVIGR